MTERTRLFEPEEEEELEDAAVAMSGRSIFLSAVQLKDLLKKKKFDDFKKKLNLPTNLEDKEDLEVLVRLADDGKTKSGRKAMNKNLFDFLCCLAGCSLDSAGMSIVDQYLNLDIQFAFWLRDLHLSQEMVRGVLRLFPGNRLPDYFLKHVDLMTTAPSRNWIKSHGIDDLSVEKQTKCKFGSIVKSHFETCKKEINRQANPLWINPVNLPSGVSAYAYLYFIRTQLWPAKALECAEYSVKQAFVRGQKDKEKKGGVTAKYKKSEHMTAISAKAAALPFEPNWFPDWWLTFLFLGMPAKDHARDCFLSGNAVRSNEAYMSIRDLGRTSRRNRRGIDKLLASTGPEMSPISSIRTSDETMDTKRQRLDVCVHNNSISEYQKKSSEIQRIRRLIIESLKSQLDTMERMKFPKNHEKYLQVATKLLEQQEEESNALLQEIEKRA